LTLALKSRAWQAAIPDANGDDRTGRVFGPVHEHIDRPGMVYILQGRITDHRDGVATEYGPGVGWPEDKNATHWLENRGTTSAVEISVDIVRAS